MTTSASLTEWRAASAKVMSEAELQREVCRLAKMFGWRYHHSRPAVDRSGRWSTPISGDKGLPDLILVNEKLHLLLMVELKRQREKPTEDQVAWLRALAAAGVQVRVWRPMDLLDGTVERALRGDVDRPTAA